MAEETAILKEGDWIRMDKHSRTRDRMSGSAMGYGFTLNRITKVFDKDVVVYDENGKPKKEKEKRKYYEYEGITYSVGYGFTLGARSGYYPSQIETKGFKGLSAIEDKEEIDSLNKVLKSFKDESERGKTNIDEAVEKSYQAALKS